MASRYPSPKRVKSHRSYTVEAAADLLGVHKSTVRRWINDEGLPALRELHPMLILGSALKLFLQTRRTKNKKPCRPGELYCFRCRVPKKPDPGLVEFKAITAKVGNLLAVCPDCTTIMNQRIGMAKLERISPHLHVAYTQLQERIGDTSKPSVCSDFEGVTQI